MSICIKDQIQNMNLVIGCTVGCTYCYARNNVKRWHMIDDFADPEFFPGKLRMMEKKRPQNFLLTGMSDEFDMVAMESMSNQYLGGDSSLSCSFETQTLLDKKVVELVRRQHEKAYKILEDNIEKLHELAKYLYEHETITGEEFMKILNDPPKSLTASAE